MEESLHGTAPASRTADRYQVVVHVPAATFAERAQSSPAASGEPPVIEQGPVLHPETLRRLTCDGALVSMLEDGSGSVLNVGRRTRVIPPAMRRALVARDRHCRYPGCGQTRYVDGHHIVHWSGGGETRLDNLVLLCRRHHRLVHEFGYRITRGEQGFEFRKP